MHLKVGFLQQEMPSSPSSRSFFLLLWVLREVSKREFWREVEAETKSNEGGFICLRLLGGKFFTVKYPLPYTLLSFATIEAC